MNITMLLEVKTRAPAKVNIGLRVLPRRDDGFHGIEGIFQTVGFYDDLTVRLLPEQDCCRISCEGGVLPARNTITAAYRAFCRLTGRHDGVQVALTKRIPAGGGLGGGSSDAAAFTRAFARLTGVVPSVELLDAVAAQVGSDVFFFMRCDENGGAALVTGRGERVTPIAVRQGLHFVLVLPEVHSSTAEAYALLDEMKEAGDKTCFPQLEELTELYYGPLEGWTFANAFTLALERKYPVIGDALADIRRSGAVWAEMTGSGACVFGVYDSAVVAKSACRVLHKSWRRCVLAQ